MVDNAEQTTITIKLPVRLANCFAQVASKTGMTAEELLGLLVENAVLPRYQTPADDAQSLVNWARAQGE